MKLLAAYAMNRSFRPAREVAQPRIAGGMWLDHALLQDDDISWLEQIERLTLWNVKAPVDFIAKLPKLWWLDIRGGSAVDLQVAAGASNLKYLAVNQVRGLNDLSRIASFPALRMVEIYGLANVLTLPSFASLRQLQRVQIGQMKGLRSIKPVLDAPNLKELLLLRKVPLSKDDAAAINDHPTLTHFHWSAEDVPMKAWEPVVAVIDRPRTRAMHPEEWFGLKDHASQSVAVDPPRQTC